MDLSFYALVKASRRRLRNMIPVCAPVDRRFPFPDNHFDAVISVFMVEHLRPESLSVFYREAHRVLRLGGRLIVASDGAFYDAHIHPLERLIRHGRYIASEPTHTNLMTPRQCEAGIQAAGFRLARRTIHWVAGRHAAMRILYRLLPAGLAERFLATMYIIEAEKK
jgi:SAM-dependent methyltransferase